ncbi:hypothetical protein [Lichenicoccus sp.]|uniref:hypothetical protein n=1 Tax=Lichenicoccus sp. TaxID=2781899 RepID=UPI003D14D141
MLTDPHDEVGVSTGPFRLDESIPGTLRVQTGRPQLTIGLHGLACRWAVRLDDVWVEAMRDRPTQSYNFGWWDAQVRHYVARPTTEQYFGLGERSGGMDRAGRRYRLSNIDALGYDARSSDPLYKHMPFFITRKPGIGSSAAGLCFGVFYDTLSDCVFDFG